MDSHSWSRFSASSRRHQNVLQSRFDPYMECEDVDGGEDDARAEFACPFCAEDFDIVGLCCHIDDEHPVEAKNGVCPVCEARVGMDMELREGHLQSLLGGSSFTVPPSNAAPDPLLSSFIYVANSSKDVQLQKLDEGSSTSKKLNNKTVESVESSLSVKDQEEKARRSEFVRELTLSTIFEDIL